MKVGNIVILANLGELKVYEAKPRDLEAEAGIKPENVKLDLIHDRNYLASHQKLHEVLTDQAGQFKGGSQERGSFSRGGIAEKHTIEKEIEESVLREIAKDVSQIITEKNTAVYLAIPETIHKRVTERMQPQAKEKVVKIVEKDLMKTDKTELVDLF
ncbi:host attachment protein [Sulfurovum sp. ST-21]|uniref:Host attachment protein n=1 Tax=Sulfurovum indicum TaxID=2779528 RepID=A0A7M1S5K1_9BACT|nr:host attachment protein [Sulfurovum indicum]QOR62697.1 host attachment protein [Sulfurovum indicum]